MEGCSTLSKIDVPRLDRGIQVNVFLDPAVNPRGVIISLNTIVNDGLFHALNLTREYNTLWEGCKVYLLNSRLQQKF